MDGAEVGEQRWSAALNVGLILYSIVALSTTVCNLAIKQLKEVDHLS